jgi:hypothetical protein
MTSPTCTASPRVPTPSVAASRPRSQSRAGVVRAARAVTATVLAMAACLSVAACQTGDAQVTPPVVLGMTSSMPAFYSDAQNTIYQVKLAVPLPMRKPAAAELNSAATPPYPRAPFLLESDVRIEIRFTLTNLDDTPHTVELLVDPWNEFVRYRPAIQLIDEENTRVDLSGNDTFHTLGPKERKVGVITPDDTRELAVDLATIENILAHPPDPTVPGGFSTAALINRAVNLQNRSTNGDPILTPFIPAVVAGLVGFDLGLRSSAQANIAVEITVDVTDLKGNRVIVPGDTQAPIGMPSGVVSTTGG